MDAKLIKLLIRVSMVAAWIGILGGILLFIQYMSFGSSAGKTLTVLAMPNSINADAFDAFEREHGVKVHFTYAENADELYMKLTMAETAGYDVVMISDYQVSLLRKNNLIQPLNKEALSFFADMYPALLNHSFDPDNAYSVPYYWGIYGFAVDTDFFGEKQDFGWEALFDEQKIFYTIGMREDIREIILMAALYLFGRIDNLAAKEYEEIKQLLITQKKWVTMYADERIGSLLASRACPLVVTLTGDIMRTMALYPNIKFFIPQQGGFVDIDSFVIPVGARQTELVYAFLNYLYTPEVLGYYVDTFKFSSPVKTVASVHDSSTIGQPTIELFKQLYFFDTPIPPAVMTDIVVSLKTAYA